ncbi:Transposase type 1 [Trinorchestia longiramus]|nr:Transposase type 1 [Trinorchestia longiramus]
MLSLRNTNDLFLDRIVTCDEKWVLYDNRKRSGQWLDRDEPPKHFPKPMLHQKNIMVTVWWSAIGVIHYSFLGANETINAERYCDDLAVMHARLSENRPALVNRRGPILLHHNATTSHSATSTTTSHSATSTTTSHSATSSTTSHSAASSTTSYSAASSTTSNSAASSTTSHSAASSTTSHSAASSTTSYSAASSTTSNSAASSTTSNSAASSTTSHSAASSTTSHTYKSRQFRMRILVSKYRYRLQ